MLQSFLLIGVGGSGGATLRYAQRELDRRLKADGWTEGIPTAWQFLHIDVPEVPDGFGDDVPIGLDDKRHYLGLARHPNKYQHYDEQLAQADELLPALAGWRPEPGPLNAIPVWNGAGQRRVVGRTIALSELTKIRERVSVAVSLMTDAKAKAQLQRLEDAIGEGPERAEPGRVFVVCSLGGGSGSGAFLDISELLMCMGTKAAWLAHPVSVLYAPGVFTDMSGTGQVAANSLAAVSELLSGYSHEGPLAAEQALLLELGGGAGQIVDRRGPRYNLVIGRDNDTGIGFASPGQVFQAVGRALVSFVANPAVSADFDSYLTTNWRGPADRLGFTPEAQENPCSSFGYANISLGNSLFERYSGERLARAAVERLVAGHNENRTDDDRRTEDAVIAERAGDLAPSFFDACRLDEVGSRSQILDSLRDGQEVREALTRTLARLRERLSADTRELAPDEWHKVFKSELRANGRKLAAELRDRRLERAGEWVRDVQQRLLDQTADLAGRAGIPVTVAVLELLGDQLTEACRSLEADSARFHKDVGEAGDRIKKLFKNIKNKLIGAGHASVGTAVEDGQEAMAFEAEAEVRDLAVLLIQDLDANLVRPLRRTYESALSNLRTRLDDAREEERLGQWPEDEVVPRHLLPTPNEMLLLPVEDFPARFDDGVSRTFDAPPGDALGEAVREVVSGSWVRDVDAQPEVHQTLLDTDQRWHPKDNEVRAVDHTPQAARFTCDLTLDVVLARADDWLEHRRGAMGGASTESIADYLDPDHQQAAARGRAFVDALERALDAARPLVRVNGDALGVVHGNHQVELSLALDRLPVADANLRTDTDRLLMEAGIPQTRLGSYYDPGSTLDELEITTFYSGALSPLVFSSLTDPILEDWRKARMVPRTRNRFWQLRRARQLPAFVPLSPSKQRAMAEGWYTAQLLGDLDRGDFDPRRFELPIWTPEGRRVFPKFLLGQQPRAWGEVFGALLETLPVAMMSVSGGGTDELDAYRRLLELGGEEDDLTDELVDWIAQGTRMQGAPTPPAHLAGEATGSPEERAAIVLERVDQLLDAIEVHIDPARTRLTRDFTLGASREWELRYVTSEALTSLRKRVEAAAAAVPSTPSDGLG